MADDSNIGKVLWFIAGAAIGSAVGMLFAPAPGEEVRRKLVDKTAEGRDAIEHQGRDLFERGREIYERGRRIADDAAEMFERGRRLVEGVAGRPPSGYPESRA